MGGRGEERKPLLTEAKRANCGRNFFVPGTVLAEKLVPSGLLIFISNAYSRLVRVWADVGKVVLQAMEAF